MKRIDLCLPFRLLSIGAAMLICVGCGGGLKSNETAQLRDVPQLQVYALTPDGAQLLGRYRYDRAAGVTQQDKPVLIDRIKSALHDTVDASAVDPESFQPDYAIDAGAMVIAIDVDSGIAEVSHQGEKRLVRARAEIATSLKTIVEGRTITNS